MDGCNRRCPFSCGYLTAVGDLFGASVSAEQFLFRPQLDLLATTSPSPHYSKRAGAVGGEDGGRQACCRSRP